MRTFSDIAIIALISGCSSVNPLFYQSGFRSFADGSIGQNAIEFTKYRKVIEKKDNSDGTSEYYLLYTHHSHLSGKDTDCTWAVITAPN